MLTLPPSVQIFLATEPVDMRMGHDGLFAIIRHVFCRSPFLGQLFVFYGRRKDRLKVFFFDRGGFVIFYKRLEKGRFCIPTPPRGATTIELDGVQLSLLLDGIDMTTVCRPILWTPTEAVA